MKTNNFISIEHLCSIYEVEVAFVSNLKELGLVQLIRQEEKEYIHQDSVHDVERMIRIHKDLQLTPEGIDVVFNLLDTIEGLQQEMNTLKNRLQLYENE